MIRNDKRNTKGKGNLRIKAERILDKQISEISDNVESGSLKQLIHELQIHKVELEMQNQELWRTQDELLLSREKFSNLYNLTPVSFFTLDGLGIIKDCNFSATRMLNISKDKLEGIRFQSFIDADHLEIFYTFLEGIVTSEVSHSCTVKFFSNHISPFYGLVEGIATIPDASSEKLCNIAVINVTDKKEFELKLKENKENLEMALLAAKAGTWLIELKTNKLFWDDNNHMIYGLQPGSFDGQYNSFLNLIHPEDREKTDTAFLSVIHHQTELNLEYRVMRPQGDIRFVRTMGRLRVIKGETHSFTGITMDITAQKKLEEEAIMLRLEQQKKILNTVIQTQEAERKRISESLHNGLAQLLYAIKLNIPTDVTLEEEGYKRLNTLIEEAIEQTRTISFELSPTILKDFGLIVALDEMIRRLSNKNLNIVTQITHFDQKLDEILETSLYRIIQELLNNIVKHAAATEVLIKLEQIGNFLLIEITDNGVGFDCTLPLTCKGIGLRSIRNRIELLNGKFQIHSAPTQGTRVSITVELREENNG